MSVLQDSLRGKDFGIMYKDDLTDLEKLYNLDQYRHENGVMDTYHACPGIRQHIT